MRRNKMPKNQSFAVLGHQAIRLNQVLAEHIERPEWGKGIFFTFVNSKNNISKADLDRIWGTSPLPDKEAEQKEDPAAEKASIDQEVKEGLAD